ncbi:hypothetical protein [Bosea sp. BIWAKO-01]|uniref:hypothetical protein n=1 Tax=Bosea sp. BIWAKO-01 TaxID=506668 RepID=UPI00085321E6|nr:hypothetical protein [Bosea sp. BIWAKO-01]GAU85694.1 hypothetical protein BIWAKO_05642 [Bosea sp. BIWAKO-01]
MISLTLSDGSPVQLLPRRVARIRRAVPGDGDPQAKTRIDCVDVLLVVELPDYVAAVVGEKLPTLAELALPDGSPVWFDAEKASGPLPLESRHQADGVASSLHISGKRQFVGSSHEDVAEVISSAGGSALPIPRAGLFSKAIGLVHSIRDIRSQEREWD